MTFLETIKLKDGQFFNLNEHQDRINKVCLDFQLTFFELSTVLLQQIYPKNGFYKVRLLYGTKPAKLEFHPYQFRMIHTLKLIEGNSIDYSYKWENRSSIQQLFQQRGIADDVLILKNGFLTDTSYANIALFDGNNFFTPSTPLLNGTKRAHLIKKGVLKEIPLKEKDLSRFQSLHLLNALIDLEDDIKVAISSIQ